MVFNPYDREATIRWYNEHSKRYDVETFQPSDSVYAGDAYRIELVRQLMAEHRPGKTLDVGCGTCEPMIRLLGDGFDVRGFDFSAGMIDVAQGKLVEAGLDAARASVGDICNPSIVSDYGEASFDAVVANGVLPYIAERDRPHEHMSRMLKPGGLYVSVYCNALFDLTTMNRFTARFHREQFIEAADLTPEEKKAAGDALERLLVHPTEPISIAEGARNDIYVSADNPLTMGKELERWGLRQIDMLFYKFHAFPPLIKELVPSLSGAFMRSSRAYEIARARDWRGFFLASTFMIVCRKE